MKKIKARLSLSQQAWDRLSFIAKGYDITSSEAVTQMIDGAYEAVQDLLRARAEKLEADSHKPNVASILAPSGVLASSL